MNPIASCAALVLAVCGLAVPAAAGAREAGAFPSFIGFNAGLLEFPEGLAVDKVGNVYVSIRVCPGLALATLSDQIWKFSPTGEKSILADFGTPGGGGCGLAVDAEGNVYMARFGSDKGVYRVDREGGIALVPGTNQITHPNGLAFDKKGNLYVTETYTGSAPNWGPGGIWRVPRGGEARLWLQHELLTGLQPTLFPIPAGANDIAFYRGHLYVINSDKDTVVQVAVQPDGSPGVPEVWKQITDVPESFFYGSPTMPLLLDGLAFDALGNVYVTVPSRNAIVRFGPDDPVQETFAVHNPLTADSDVPLDGPVNVAFGTASGEQTNLFVSNMGIVAMFVPGQSWPGPGLTKIPVGIPGSPLP